jgi:hypothetical protein
MATDLLSLDHEAANLNPRALNEQMVQDRQTTFALRRIVVRVLIEACSDLLNCPSDESVDKARAQYNRIDAQAQAERAVGRISDSTKRMVRSARTALNVIDEQLENFEDARSWLTKCSVAAHERPADGPLQFDECIEILFDRAVPADKIAREMLADPMGVKTKLLTHDADLRAECFDGRFGAERGASDGADESEGDNDDCVETTMHARMAM